MVRRDYLSQHLHLMLLEMMNVLARKLCSSWEIYSMSSIKNVNCILLQVGADYSNYYYLLFLSTISAALGDSGGNVPVRGGTVIFIFLKRHRFVWLTF